MTPVPATPNVRAGRGWPVTVSWTPASTTRSSTGQPAPPPGRRSCGCTPPPTSTSSRRCPRAAGATSTRTRRSSPGRGRRRGWRRAQGCRPSSGSTPARPMPRSCAVRPPGHHATADRGRMGFCLLNNVAVTAAALADARRAGGHRRLGRAPRQRHPGRLLGRPPRAVRVLAPAGRCTPAPAVADEVGGPAALGSTMNLPLPGAAPPATSCRPRSTDGRRAGRRGVRPDVGARVGRLRRPPRRPARRPRPAAPATSPTSPRASAPLAPQPGRLVAVPGGRLRPRRPAHLGRRRGRGRARGALPAGRIDGRRAGSRGAPVARTAAGRGTRGRRRLTSRFSRRANPRAPHPERGRGAAPSPVRRRDAARPWPVHRRSRSCREPPRAQPSRPPP